MRSLAGMLSIYLLIKAVLLGVGIGIGFLLHWLMPSVDLGVAMLIGVVTTGLSLHYFARLTTLLITEPDDNIETLPADDPTIYTIERLAPRRRSKRRRS